MDIRGSPAFHSHHQQEGRIEGSSTTTMLNRIKAENPFLDDDAFQVEDPLCKLNLKNCSGSSSSSSSSLLDISSGVERRREFNNGMSNSYSFSTRRNSVAEAAPPTPGRPIFSFSSTKGLSSKWEDAEKWLISTTNATHRGHLHHHDSLASSAHYHHYNHHGLRPPPLLEFSSTNSRVSNVVSGFSNERSSQADLLLLKDKFTNHEAADYYDNCHFSTTTTKFKSSSSSSEPMKQAFFFGNFAAEKEKPILKNAATESVSVLVVNDGKRLQQHKDIGTEMTPLGSSPTSRCPTPFMSTSPARYNTPENRSGPLAITTQIEEGHFAKLSSNYYWSSREEEQEEISKSLRHFELNINDVNDHSDDDECKKNESTCENRSCGWGKEQSVEDDKTKCCLRYQREEAKIQAWVNLQMAKAEAQSRKLEVKIEKMRSNLEEKLMKKMGVVHRKAEEMRAVYQLQHLEQAQKRKSNSNSSNNIIENAPKLMTASNTSTLTCSYFTKYPSNHSTCGCFPCSTINQFY